MTIKQAGGMSGCVQVAMLEKQYVLVWCIEVLKLGEGSGVRHRAYKRLHHFRVWPKGWCKCLQALQNELPALAHLHRLLI